MSTRIPVFHESACRLLPGLAAVVAATCLATGTAAAARAPTKALTEGLETGTDVVNLPATPGGTLSATQCRGCPIYRLRFDGNTRYFIGKESVSYARFREAAGKHTQTLYVSFRIEDKTLTRLRLPAAAKQ